MDFNDEPKRPEPAGYRPPEEAAEADEGIHWIGDPYAPPRELNEELIGAEAPGWRPSGPRIWVTLLVAVLIIPAAIVVSLFALLIALPIYFGPGFAIENPNEMTRQIAEFSATRVGLLILIVPGQMVFLGAALLGGWFSRQRLADRLGLERGRMPVWTWPVFALATPLIGFVVAIVLSNLDGQSSKQLEMLNEVFRAHAGEFLIGLIVLISILPGVAEELLFRGYLQRRMIAWSEHWAQDRTGGGDERRALSVLASLVAIGICSLLFAVAHLDPIHAIAVAPLGFWLGIVAWRCGSIWPAIFGHMANNLIAVIGIRLSDPTSEPGVISRWELYLVAASLLAFTVSVVLLIIGGAKRDEAESVVPESTS